MSHRSNVNNGSRHNPGFHTEETPLASTSTTPQQLISQQSSQHVQQTSFQPFSAPINEKAGISTTASPSHSLYYHPHRGHKRGHSYGGPVSPAAAAFHHRLEPRPSHPNAQHGTLPPLVQMTSSALLKGHRRALSGCMPMMGGIGVVAWSSLKELHSPISLHANIQSLRSRSPDELPGEFQPSSPDKKKSGLEQIRPISPEPVQSLEKDNLNGVECGFGSCLLPNYFNEFANIRVFVAILAMLVTLQQAVASGYLNSVITTIELRFEIPSKYTGLVASAYEMGNVVTVLFVSYLGAKRHIPRWIAVGVLVMVLGCVIFTLPHFISTTSSYSYRIEKENPSKLTSSEYLDKVTLNNTNFQKVSSGIHLGKNGICHAQNPPSPSKFISSVTSKPDDAELNFSSQDYNHFEGSKDNIISKAPMSGCEIETAEDGTVTTIEPESLAHPLILFTIAQILLGVGGSPLFTLGITFVDDHVPKSSSSVYIGLVYAMGAFGPVLGFLMGAWLLTIPASFNAPPDAEFIGMWWGGFLIVGFLLFIACLPFLTFPRLLQKTKSKEEYSLNGDNTNPEPSNNQGSIEVEYGQSIRDIPRSMYRLFRNSTFVVTCLAGCMEMNIISGFVVFLPKYLETQFGLGKSEASVFTGGIAIPGAFFGILAGGYLMKKLELKPSGAAKLVVIAICICLMGQSSFFFLGCTNPKLAGATVPYPDSLNPLEYTPYNVNLTSYCNLDCSCDSSVDAQYVCARGITYFSPCHAGCLGNFTHCTCAGGGDVTPGVCPDSPCSTLLPFMIILFFMTATVAMMQMPSLMIILRSVSEEERSFALGMQFVLFRLLGYIPSPIIFGNVIDSSCLLWSIRRCSSVLPAVSGRCLRYDIMDFRYKYVGMLTGFKLMALVLFMYNCFQLKRLERHSEEIGEMAGEDFDGFKLSTNSVYSLDKLFEEDLQKGMNDGYQKKQKDVELKVESINMSNVSEA